MSIPYYDSDHKLIDMLSEKKAERYLAAGTAKAIRTKSGRIVRLYRRTSERTYPSEAAAVRAMHASASQYTTRMRNDWGTIIAPPLHREHRK